MSAGARFEYHWQDGVTFKRPTKVSAPEYVDYLMDWVQKQLDDEAVFPSRIGKSRTTRPRGFRPQTDTRSRAFHVPSEDQGYRSPRISTRRSSRS